MSLIRTGIVLAGIVMLLPTDERRQAEIAGVAGTAVERTVSFCERNPGTCTAGRELWATFLRKAEFGVELASKLVREQMSREPAPRELAPREAVAREPVRDAGLSTVTGSPRFEPVAPSRGTLSRADASVQWRGVSQERLPVR